MLFFIQVYLIFVNKKRKIKFSSLISKFWIPILYLEKYSAGLQTCSNENSSTKKSKQWIYLKKENIISSDFLVIAASIFDNSGFRGTFSQLKNIYSNTLANLTCKSQGGTQSCHVRHKLVRRRTFVKMHPVVSCWKFRRSSKSYR